MYKWSYVRSCRQHYACVRRAYMHVCVYRHIIYILQNITCQFNLPSGLPDGSRTDYYPAYSKSRTNQKPYYSIHSAGASCALKLCELASKGNMPSRRNPSFNHQVCNCEGLLATALSNPCHITVLSTPLTGMKLIHGPLCEPL